MKPGRHSVTLIIGIVAGLVVGAVAASVTWVLVNAHSGVVVSAPSGSQVPSAGPTSSAPIAPATIPVCPSVTTPVSSTEQLTTALSTAKPGAVIGLADGIYSGNFVATAVATATSPIWLCGGPEAILDGKKTTTGYVLHLDGTSHWNLLGFSIRDGQKGVVADKAHFVTINGLTVDGIGDEAIHLRAGSTDNTVRGNTISHTGLLKAKFGEGVYIGTARKNWCSITNCEPDRSDRNIIIGNHISHTTAENVDIKEGTTGGQLVDNSFDGVGMVDAGATAWVNVKGNNWRIVGNTGVNSIGDGFQTHQILAGWGDNNTFLNNRATVNGPGFGFHLTPPLSNVVECNNAVTGAARGSSSITCSGG